MACLSFITTLFVLTHALGVDGSHHMRMRARDSTTSSSMLLVLGKPACCIVNISCSQPVNIRFDSHCIHRCINQSARAVYNNCDYDHRPQRTGIWLLVSKFSVTVITCGAFVCPQLLLCCIIFAADFKFSIPAFTELEPGQ
ncbi:hypothetical protein GE09DRAFT_260250 [Coniochaeta sp. 2T2.1]|nr:hypothetical protein GE09DRAFT_260250 [Coniochaeta sp. 2T2.1]